MSGVERPRKRRTRELLLEEEWHPATNADSDLEKRKYASKLFELLLGLYALTKLTAKDFCVICYACDLAGLKGADFASYAKPPDNDHTGDYQK